MLNRYTPISVTVFSAGYSVISVSYISETVLYYDLADVPQYIRDFMDMAHKVSVDNTLTVYANSIGM